MIYLFAADALLLVHLLFIVFVVFGGLLILKWRWLIFFHIPAVTWGALVEFNHWGCPLTPWENSLRHAGGSSGYETSFIEHYLLPLIYPVNLTDNLQLLLGSIVIIVNLAIYLGLALKIRKN